MNITKLNEILEELDEFFFLFFFLLEIYRSYTYIYRSYTLLVIILLSLVFEVQGQWLQVYQNQ
jgi:hypothetical protein